MTLAELRQKHSALHYHGYQIDLVNKQLKITYLLSLEPNLTFKPTLTLPIITAAQLADKDPIILDQLFFHLGLVEMLSYWKAACPARVIIHHGSQQTLSAAQLTWWHDLFIKGMSEFYLTNNINFTQENFLKLELAEEQTSTLVETLFSQQPNFIKGELANIVPYLVPVGGGKDSALTLGILDKAQIDYDCLLLEPQSPAAQQVVNLSRSKQNISISRTIDPNLLELNQTGYLNGHTPFSAYLAFLSTTIAYLYNYQTILVANERSANEGNQQFHGLTVNHQYSKTFEFEQKFRQYVSDFLAPQTAQQTFPAYLSFLRPLWEIQIAQAFAQYPQYHSIFKSCNVGQKQGIWCEHCPKCLFVFTMLFPFIETAKLTNQIFSQNLFKKAELTDEALELAGLNQAKPLECVGTYAETQAAFYLAIQKYQQQGVELPPVLAAVQEKILQYIPDMKQKTEQLLTAWNEEHNLPKKLAKLLKTSVQK